ncbi:hypothetical protein E3N88_32852 [Mikania micrantha]|uniref:Small ribosomal subunit protein uS7 domain-containing protein n=1 Tax=Mikania micrantha TaxID=192012 RepID=A0A5N6MA59_9ASTR|nr:hypothetical protein E3N88_32852 [Mikania micrantha]
MSPYAMHPNILILPAQRIFCAVFGTGGARAGGGAVLGGRRKRQAGSNQSEMEVASIVEDGKARSDVLLFNRWTYDDVQVSDLSVEDYITATASKHPIYMPHTAGRYQAKRFRKAQCPIVERLTNSLMMHGRNNGKKLMAVRIVKHAMEIIHLLTDANPIQIIVDAVINSGPREDATRIGSAGVVRRQAVDISPLRRVNQAIYLLTTGARESAFRNVKTIAECLADELINAAKGSSNRYRQLCLYRHVAKLAAMQLRRKMRLRESLRPIVEDFLRVVPIDGLGQHMSALAYWAILKYRLMIPLFPADEPCPVCHKVCLDSFGEHAVHCKELPGSKYRHDLPMSHVQYVTKCAWILLVSMRYIVKSYRVLNTDTIWLEMFCHSV